MRRVIRSGRLALLAVAIFLAVVATPAAPARSAAPALPAPSAITSFTVPGSLDGVAASSATNAWAVGADSAGKTLILHWNGTEWSQVTSPKPVYGTLWGVTAVSADNAWAVGWTSTATGADPKTLIMHWNGSRWSVQASAPAVAGWLYAVTVSGDSIWAVGGTSREPSLILHGIGNRWYVVPSESPAGSYLEGVVVTGDSTAWADGGFSPARPATGYRGLLLRWNGTIWQPASSPLQGANNGLLGLAANPAGVMWAVGTDWNGKLTAATATSMVWDGKTWRMVPLGSLPPSSALFGVTFVPGGTAWAVGYDDDPNAFFYGGDALILRWTGHAWTQAAIPNKGNSYLDAVAATSASNAWAVGSVGTDTLILHWNGKIWR